MSDVEYRIEFAIQRKRPEDEDFAEVGFGSSGAWGSIEAASHMAGSAIECREWETTGDMPKPEDA